MRQLFRHFDSDAMLGYNTSMKVVEERFQLELSHYGYTQFELDLFTFWVIVPNGKYNIYGAVLKRQKKFRPLEWVIRIAGKSKFYQNIPPFGLRVRASFSFSF